MPEGQENVYIWRVLLFTFQVSQTCSVTKGYSTPTPTCYHQRTLWVKRRSASPAGSQCSNTEQWFPTYLRKGTPVQLCEEGTGDTGSEDHRNWTRRWQKGKTSNLHLVQTPVINPTSVCSSDSKCFSIDDEEKTEEKSPRSRSYILIICYPSPQQSSQGQIKALYRQTKWKTASWQKKKWLELQSKSLRT